jgi:hypothetical protein
MENSRDRVVRWHLRSPSAGRKTCASKKIGAISVLAHDRTLATSRAPTIACRRPRVTRPLLLESSLRSAHICVLGCVPSNRTRSTIRAPACLRVGQHLGDKPRPFASRARLATISIQQLEVITVGGPCVELLRSAVRAAEVGQRFADIQQRWFLVQPVGQGLFGKQALVPTLSASYSQPWNCSRNHGRRPQESGQCAP